jgi:hypothetical protein
MRSNIPELSFYSWDHSLVYVSLIYANVGGNKQYQHKLENNCFTITAKLLRERLKSDYNDMFKHIGLITIAAQYDKVEKTTRAYKLTSKAIELTLAFLQSEIKRNNPPTTIQLKTNNDNLTAIKSRDKNNNNSYCRLFINPVVKIDVDALQQLVYDLDNGLYENSDSWIARRKAIALQLIYESKHYTFADKPVNTIVQHYRESESGRLYGIELHLQNAPSEVRIAALNGQYKYDFENCHYSIFSQLCKSIGANTPFIDYYLKHKSKLRNDLAQQYDVPVAEIKRCFIAIIYGASIGLSERQTLCRILGRNTLDKLRKQKHFAGIHNEIKQHRDKIIALYSTPKRVRNSIGKTLHLNKVKKISNKQKLAHILQGHEAQMLCYAIELHGKSITLLQHDGFYSTDATIDTGKLSTQIYAKTGLFIAMSKETAKTTSMHCSLVA